MRMSPAIEMKRQQQRCITIRDAVRTLVFLLDLVGEGTTESRAALSSSRRLCCESGSSSPDMLHKRRMTGGLGRSWVMPMECQ